MNEQSFQIERVFNAPPAMVWKAITEKELMKQWYFDLAEFRAEKGFRFEFSGGPSPERQYLHQCEVLEVIHQKKLKHSWCYAGYEGLSTVTFELFEEGTGTRLRLTHDGLGTFPADNADLAKHNFEAGWTAIIGTNLKNFLETIIK